MKTFVIEREIPGSGSFTEEKLAAISRKSCDVADNLGTDYRWVHSYVTNDKWYCIHMAPDAETVRRHAREGGFPADTVSEVCAVVGPETAA